MRKIQRLAAVGAMAALTVTLAACGGETATPDAGTDAGAQTSAPAAAAPTSAADAATGDGVTTNDDVVGPACDQLPQGDEEGSLNQMGPLPVATAASGNPLLTTLVTAVQAAGLADTLNQQEAITVYAPANPAFDAVKESMGDEAFNALLANPEQLGAILQYHVVPKRYDAEGLVEAGTTTQLSGGEVTVGGTADAPTFMGAGNTEPATTLCGNIPTSNATVFVIDQVLMPAAS